MWARIGIRAFYGQALSSIAAENPNVMAVSADLGRSSGLDRFSKEYPDQFLNSGIAEQNMVGVSAGLARMGFDVFASTFAPFASMRASEQVRMNMGYMHEPVKLVALGSGLAMGFLGNSHYRLEISVMRAIPGLTIISPADCAEVYKTVEACIGFEHPVYIRLTGAVSCPVVILRIMTLRSAGPSGFARHRSHNHLSWYNSRPLPKAAEALEEDGIDVGLLNMHTIKPLDEKAITKAVSASDTIL